MTEAYHQVEEPPVIRRSMLARWGANLRQLWGFLSSNPWPEKRGRKMPDLYQRAIEEAFAPAQPFLVTGAPHRALYLREFACFYPDILDSETVVSRADAASRTILLERSVKLMLASIRQGDAVTTLVPAGTSAGRKRFVGIDYFSEPSDSLLGIMGALEQLMHADADPESPYADIFSRAAGVGRTYLEEYRPDLARAVLKLAGSLERVRIGGKEYLLCDASKPRSAATDTRVERARFVTNANMWTTFSRAVELGIVDAASIERILGRTLAVYKEELLELFGGSGFVRHSLECQKRDSASCIALDFAHIHRGFWNLEDSRERALFRSTADIILSDPRFHGPSQSLFLMSIRNPRRKLIHRLATPAYQGRTAWSAFNVEFADRLLDLGAYEGEQYAEAGREILKGLYAATESHEGYPELLSRYGRPYKTWAYRSAVAHSWFPRFASVWRKAFGESLVAKARDVARV